jgi:antitoxin ParD1/3/4
MHSSHKGNGMPTPPKSLNVSLTLELISCNSSRVALGRYHSAREVVRAALRLLEREEVGLSQRTRGPKRAYEG